MLKRYLRFNLLFALIFVLQIISGLFDIGYFSVFVNSCIALSLLIFLSLSTKLKGRFHKRLFAGLVFALFGDVLLIYAAHDELYFMFGMAAFLLCYIFYISAFYLDFKSAPELDKKGARIAILLCAILAIGFYFYLRPHLGMMKLPVMIYILVVSMMVMMASFRNRRVNTSSFKLVLFGAICFLASDGILAYHKFVQPFDYASVWIMATYMAAQYLITIGGVERKLLHNN